MVGAFRRLVGGCIALAVVVAAPVGRSAEDVPAASVIARIETAFAPPVVVTGEPKKTRTLAETMAELHVPGISVAYIHDGRIAWTGAWGVVQPGGAPVTPETRFQAASISKSVTALAVLELVEAGRLDLDADVNRYLKSWRVAENTFTASEKVTLRRLLTHTAGVTVHGFEGYAAGTPAPSLLQVLNGEKPANSPPITVDTVPGTEWRYSGGGYEIVQQLLLDVAGEPFPELMRKSVLARAGMSRSTYEQPLPAALTGQAAVPFRRDGEPVPGGAHTYPEMAAAGLWTTPSDLARLLIRVQDDLAGKPGGLLNPAMTRAALTPSNVGGWGLGFSLGGSGEHRYFTHGGANDGFRAIAIAYEHGDGVVIMTNGDQGGPLQDAVVRTLAQAYGWPDFQPSVRTVATVDDKALDACLGRYEFVMPKGFGLTVTRQGERMFVRMGDQAPHEFFPEGGGRFFDKDVDAELTFQPGPNGEAGKVVLHQDGRDFEAVRQAGG